jgi:hypothetical protein
MFVPSLQGDGRKHACRAFNLTPRSSRRRAVMIPWFLVATLALFLVIYATWFLISHRNRQEELQVAAEAASLAGAIALADEELLTDHDDRLEVVRERARAATLKYAHCNFVDARRLKLDPKGLNCPDGELVLGHLDCPDSRDFDCTLENPELNAVRVKVKRGGTIAAATAYVDRDVIGFRPQGCNPLPVVPLAILADAFPSPLFPQRESWDTHIGGRLGTCHWLIDPETHKPRRIREGERDDRIPEIHVCFSTKRGRSNGRVARIGDDPAEDAVWRQVRDGISRCDLRPFGGELVLPDPRRTSEPLLLPRIELSEDDLKEFAQAFSKLLLTGERRVWMLYSPRFDRRHKHGEDEGERESETDGNKDDKKDSEDNGEKDGAKHGEKDGEPVIGVVGFVAAQVMDVRLHKDKLCVVLQPGTRITDTAITDCKRRELGPRPIHNPYVCRIRLVE